MTTAPTLGATAGVVSNLANPRRSTPEKAARRHLHRASEPDRQRVRRPTVRRQCRQRHCRGRRQRHHQGLWRQGYAFRWGQAGHLHLQLEAQRHHECQRHHRLLCGERYHPPRQSVSFTALTAARRAVSFSLQEYGCRGDRANDRIIYKDSTGSLYYDADGSGTAFAAVKFATIINNAILTNADFVVI